MPHETQPLIFFAQLFGVLSLVLSIGILFNFENSRELVREMSESATARFVSGIFPLFFGLWVLITTCCYYHQLNWAEIVVVALAIIMFMAGLFRLILVDWWVRILKRYEDKAPIFAGLFGLMFGLLLCYIGYVRTYLIG